jgi:hypothetical protein
VLTVEDGSLYPAFENHSGRTSKLVNETKVRWMQSPARAELPAALRFRCINTFASGRI